jgi:hypothetical protein
MVATYGLDEMLNGQAYALRCWKVVSMVPRLIVDGKRYFTDDSGAAALDGFEDIGREVGA